VKEIFLSTAVRQYCLQSFINPLQIQFYILIPATYFSTTLGYLFTLQVTGIQICKLFI